MRNILATASARFAVRQRLEGIMCAKGKWCISSGAFETGESMAYFGGR